MKMNHREGEYRQILKNGRTDRRNSRNSSKTYCVNLVMRLEISNFADIHVYGFFCNYYGNKLSDSCK